MLCAAVTKVKKNDTCRNQYSRNTKSNKDIQKDYGETTEMMRRKEKHTLKIILHAGLTGIRKRELRKEDKME